MAKLNPLDFYERCLTDGDDTYKVFGEIKRLSELAEQFDKQLAKVRAILSQATEVETAPLASDHDEKARFDNLLMLFGASHATVRIVESIYTLCSSGAEDDSERITVARAEAFMDVFGFESPVELTQNKYIRDCQVPF